MEFNDILESIAQKGQNLSWLYETIARLSGALAPTGSVLLPGGVGDVLEQVVGELGLSHLFVRDLHSTGNAALCLGQDPEAPGPAAAQEIVVCAHLDRAGFGVSRLRSSREAELFACSAVRVPQGRTEVGARSCRYDLDRGGLFCSSVGRFIFQRDGVETSLRYRAEQGELTLQDHLTFHHPARRRGDQIQTNSLDDTAGVAVLLGAALALARLQEHPRWPGGRVLLCFTDHEEWPAESQLFAAGSMRLGHALAAPRLGAVVMDTHAPTAVRPGEGLSYGFVSSRGKGATLPLDARAHLTALARRLNRARPGTAQFNPAYFSRADEFGLMRWAKIVGLFGVPVEGIHQGPETCDLRDVAAGVRFLTSYLALLLGALDI